MPKTCITGDFLTINHIINYSHLLQSSQGSDINNIQFPHNHYLLSFDVKIENHFFEFIFKLTNDWTLVDRKLNNELVKLIL